MSALDNAKAILDELGIEGGPLRALIAEHERVLAMPHVRILFEGQEFDGTSLAVSGGENAGYWVEGPPTHIAVAEYELVLAERATPQEWEYLVMSARDEVWALTDSLEEARHYLMQEPGGRIECRHVTPWEPLPEDTNNKETEKA